jgi:diketogulonate reductase-like aldo/keto reductase
LEIFNFELSEADMAKIDALNTNERKLVPVITLPDGSFAPRDGNAKDYPYHIEY